MSNDVKRHIAYKIPISELVESVYRKEDGIEPNHVVTKSGIKASRINIFAVVVSKSDEVSYQTVLLDDGSGKILARDFNSDLFGKINVGDFILMIGKPREFGQEKYILPEVVKKYPDSRWMEVRKKELRAIGSKIKNDGIKSYNEATGDNIRATDEMIEMIKKLDNGAGADMNDIIRNGGDEKTLNYLIMRGDVYQIRPGRLKILE